MNELGGDFSKVGACTSQPVAFNGHLSTYGHLADLRKSMVPYSRKVWRIYSFQVFGKRKFGELIDQPIDY